MLFQLCGYHTHDSYRYQSAHPQSRHNYLYMNVSSKESKPYLNFKFGCSTENVKSTCHMTQTTATISTQHYPQHTRLSLLLLLCYSSYSSELASVTCDCVSMSESSRL